MADLGKILVKNILERLVKPITEISEQENETIRQGLKRFKMDMMKFLPFYGDILMRVEVIEDKSVETAQTNGRNIRYNPLFFARLREGERNYVLLHEVLHVLLLHWKRDKGKDPLLWNIACDFVVNSMLDRMKWRLESNKVAFERPRTGCFLPAGSVSNYPVEEFYARLQAENSGDKSEIKYGSKPIMKLPKDLDCVEELDELQKQMIEKQVRELVKETIKRRGTSDSWAIPSEVLKLTATKKLPWHKLLYEFLEERADEESSYLTPERKYIHMDLIIPGISKTEDELGEIWAFVDTSGSINDNELRQFMTQLYRIAKEFHCVFNIAFWDTEVTDVYRNVKDKNKIMECKPFHSGGTDINCVYRYLKKEKIKPGVLLILTDGYFGRLTEKIGKLPSRTILVISENGCEIEKKNEFGKLARL